MDVKNVREGLWRREYDAMSDGPLGVGAIASTRTRDPRHGDLEVIRGGYAAFARGDIPAVVAMLDPGIEWTEPQGYPWGGTYVGIDRVVELFQSAAEQLDARWRVEPDRFAAIEGGVLVLGHHRGHNADGAWMVPFAMVWAMRDAKATSVRQYGDTVLMRRAASSR